MERKAIYQGTWYPSDPEILRGVVRAERKGSSARMAVLPHAGLYYSAPLIRSFFEWLDDDVTRVLIISPSHYYGLRRDEIVQSDFTSSETPLGEVETLPLGLENASWSDLAIAREHGIEMFLPFVKESGISVSYLLLSHIAKESIGRTATLIESAIDENTAIIASSDFTHYGPRFSYTPYGRSAKEKVKEHDLEAANQILSFEIDEAYERNMDGTICGLASALVVSEIARRHDLNGRIAGRYTSNEVSQSQDADFVSYVAIHWSRA